MGRSLVSECRRCGQTLQSALIRRAVEAAGQNMPTALEKLWFCRRRLMRSRRTTLAKGVVYGINLYMKGTVGSQVAQPTTRTSWCDSHRCQVLLSLGGQLALYFLFVATFGASGRSGSL